MYHHGLGIPQDLAEAAKWYRLAATQGYPQALEHLGTVEERMASPDRQPTASLPDESLLAQRATLYEEPLDSGGLRNGVVAVNAAVTWAYEPKGTDGPEIVAHIDVPERGLKIKMTLRRNTDQTLPASHVAEVFVDVPAGFPGKGIRDVPRLVLKSGKATPGQPLMGASAKVSDAP